MAGSGLISHFRALQKRVFAIGTATGLGWAGVTWLAALTLFMWTDLVVELPPGVRRVSVGLAIGAAAIVSLLVIAAALRRARSRALARRLDEVGGTRGQILSGVDLASQPAQPAGLTAALADLAIGRAHRLAGGIAATAAVPARPLGWAFGTLTAACLAALVLNAMVPGVVSTQWARFFDPYGDHPPFTRLRFEVEPGDADVVYGDKLDIEVKATGAPVDEIELVLNTSETPEGEALPMFPEPGGTWRATIAHVTTPTEYHVRADRARSHTYDIKVITVPKITAARFRVTPPGYTNRAPYEGALPQGGLSGLPATRVDVWLTSNRPLRGGHMAFELGEDQHELSMAPTFDESTEAHGSFEIREPGKVTMKVIDVEGQASRDSVTSAITLLADERPFVRLLEPQEISLATPNVALPIALSAEDDYGVSRIRLYRSLNDSRALPMEVDVPTPPPTRRQERLSLPLKDYGLQPGDEIKLFARVEDNDPAGAKGHESTVAMVRIISQADFERLARAREGMQMMQSKYAEASRRMQNILDKLEGHRKALESESPDSDVSEQMRAALEGLAAQMKGEAGEIRKLADFKLPYDLDEKLNPELEKLAEALEKASEDLEKANKKPSAIPSVAGMAEKLKQIEGQCGGGKGRFEEEATEPLEHLARIYPLLADEARFLALYRQQKDLAERLVSLKGRDGEDNPQLKARMRDLEFEQQKLREDLRNLIDDIDSHVKKLPEDERLDDLRATAQKFAQDLRASGAAEAMAEAEDALSRFSGSQGWEGAYEAEQILNAFIQRCSGMGGNGRACLKFQPKLAAGLGSTIEQMLADAGMGANMGAGFGMGTGAGGGYSANSSTLNNVGLYGGLPTMGGSPRFGSGKHGMFAGAGAGAGRDGDAVDPLQVDPTGTLQATGAASAVVPVEYRSRVGAYFQRIADEMGE